MGCYNTSQFWVVAVVMKVIASLWRIKTETLFDLRNVRIQLFVRGTVIEYVTGALILRLMGLKLFHTCTDSSQFFIEKIWTVYDSKVRECVG